MNHLRHFVRTSSHLQNPILFQRRALPITRTFTNQAEKQSAYNLHPRKTSNCPKCGQVLPTQLPTCTNPDCGYIETIPSKLREDYFGIFGLPGLQSTEGSAMRNAFSIDPKVLRRRFLQMQKVCHPDVWAKRGPDAAALADSQSSQINKAYQTLLSPRRRGEYILSRNGIDIGEADNMEEEQELAMEVMEAREQLEDAEGEEVRNLMRANAERIESAIADLENAIGTENWDDAKRAVIRLRYWESFERAAKGLEADH